MIQCLSVTNNTPPLEFLKEYIKPKDNISSKVCLILPTERNIRMLASQNIKFVELYSISSFIKMAGNSLNKELLPAQLRPFYLRKAVEKMTEQDKTAIFKNSSHIFLKNFTAFAQTSDNIFHFFRELKAEIIDMKDLQKAGLYTDYEKQIDILQSLWEIYINIIHDDNYIEEYENLGNIDINTDFINQYNEFIFLISGFLTKSELKRFKALSNIKDVTLVFNYSGSKYKQHIQYEEFLGTNSLINREVKQFNNNSLQIYSCPSYAAQYDLITKKAFEIHKKHNIDFKKMAVVIPDESIKAYFLKLDKYNLYDVSAGESIDYCQFYNILKDLVDIYQNIQIDEHITIDDIITFYSYPIFCEDNDILKEKELLLKDIKNNKLFINKTRLFTLPFFKDTAYNFLKSNNITTASESVRIFEDILKNLYKLIIFEQDEIHAGIITMQMLERIYRKIDTAMTFNETAYFILKELSTIKHNTQKGKIAVTGILESRNMQYDIIFIPALNSDIFPAKNKKDLFINMEIRNILQLPTYIDRENLLKNYLMQIMEISKLTIISYISNNNTSRRSSFVDELIIKNHITETYYNPAYIELLFNKKHCYKPFEAITIDKNKEIMELVNNIEFSASSFNNYILCPLKFYLRNIRKIEPPYKASSKIESLHIGNIYHNIFYSLYKRGFNALDENYEDEFINEYKKAMQELDLYNHSGIEKFVGDTGLINIPKIIEHEKNRLQQGFVTVNREEYISDLYFEGLKFMGRIDKIEQDQNNNIYIIDYKFKNKIDKKITSIEKITNIQMPLYALLIESKMGKIPNNLYYFDLKNNIGLEDAFDMDIYNDFKLFLKDKINELKSIDIPFMQTDKISNCKYCDYSYICGRDNDFFSK